ncbi:MAG: sulfotransferase family protein [Rubritepida sp.]|nr:sulfotransferase family protein [Rubritepida sp.]
MRAARGTRAAVLPDAPRLVFLHVSRTGGTTLHAALAARFRPEEACPERFNGLARIPAEALARYRFFSGHFTFETLRLIPAPRLVVTVLREPRTRLVSLYRFWRGHGPEHAVGNPLIRLARRHDLLSFLRSDRFVIVQDMDNRMTRQLVGDVFASAPGRYARDAAEGPREVPGAALLASARANLAAFDLLGFADALDAVHAAIAARMGWPPPPPLPRLNAGGPGVPPPESPPPDPAAVAAALDRLTTLDRPLWEHALARAGGAPFLARG